MKKLALLARIDYQRDITKLHKKLLQKNEVAIFLFLKKRAAAGNHSDRRNNKKRRNEKTCLACNIIVTDRYYKISREFITKE